MGLRRTIAISLMLAVTASAELPSAKILDRYRQMLSTNPVEGTALDRLWKAYSEAGQTGQLIEMYQKDETFSSSMVLGHLLRRAGQMEEARAAYDRAAKLDPKSPLPVLALARSHKEAGQLKDAAESYEKAAELLPEGDSQLANTLLDAGQAWISAGDVQRGASAWERAIALTPGNTELRRRLADSYVANSLPDRAVPHLDYLVEHASPADRAQALQQLAKVHRTTGDTDAAIQSLEKAIALTTPGNWLRDELQSQLIRLHQRTHRVPELEERWKKHAEENPRDIGGYLQLIALYERVADLPQKRLWLEKLVKLAPKTPAYRLRLARLYVQMDQLKDAAAFYDQLLVEQPNSPDLTFERARLDILLAQPDAAKQRIAAFLERRKGDETLRTRALEFYRHHRLWRAVEEFLVANAAGGHEEAVVSLADFLFSQSRDPEAEEQLKRLVRTEARPEEQARAWVRIAQVMKAQGRFLRARSATEEALALLPANTAARREALILSGELNSSLGELESARKALSEAVRIEAPATEQIAAEQKLFDCLRQIGMASGEATGSSDSLVLPPPDGETPTQPQALAEQIAALRKEAETQNTEDAWLRLARWHAWCRDQRAALDAANKAVQFGEKPIAAHEFVVKLTSSTPTSVAAHWHLGKLMEVDPENRVQYQRRIAQLNLQAGKLNEAILSLEKLASEQPGNLDILTDLAMAQQRAEKWEDALETWRKLLADSPASRKGEAIASLVRIYEKVNRPAPAAEVLLGEIESLSDPKQQLERFSELLAFATKHDLLPWLRTEWEKRHKRLGDDYVTEVALGRILKAQGEKAAGFQLLADASLSAPDPAIALPELVREAEEIRRLGEAARLQERLVRSVAANDLDAWLKLAELQEKNFAFEAAGQTWSRIVSHFPRDVPALLQASEFWQREENYENASTLLRRIRTLEPSNARALWSLAQLDLETGQFEEARECLEQIIAKTPAEKPGEAVRFPAVQQKDGTRLQNAYLTAVRGRGGQPTAEAMRDVRTFWSETPVDSRGSDKELRLNSIRELARITVARNDQTERTRWIERWKLVANDAPSEALWALYYADAGESALEVIEQLMERNPDDVQQKQAFIWLALQTRQGERLASWLRAPQRTSTDRDFLMIALGQHLDSHGTFDDTLLDQLFPSSAPTRLWQAASIFANRMRFPEAIKLGTRALAGDRMGNSRAGLELAQWHLAAGHPDGARQILEQLSNQLADSFDSISCAATQELYHLLPVFERKDFVERKLASLAGTPPVHAAVMSALIHSLSGNQVAARAQLDHLRQMRVMAPVATDDPGDSSSREWTFYLAAGLHLQSWKLGWSAAHLWERALADRALIRLQGDQVREIAREMRAKLAAVKLAQISPLDASIQIEDLVLEFPDDEIIAVGESLESLGALPQAIALYRRIWERDLTNPQPLRNLLNACRMADDQQTTEEVLRRCITDRIFSNDAVQRDFAGQLADLLERKGDLTGALKIITEAVASAPTDLRLLQRSAQLHEKAGKLEEAEANWRQVLEREPNHALARTSLATLLDRQGDLAAAIVTLDWPEQTDADPILPLFLIKAGRTEAAFEALERVAPAKLASASQMLWQYCLGREQRDLARASVQKGLERITDPATVFQLKCQLVETFSPATDSTIILHELRSLRREALKEPKLTAEYFNWLQKKAHVLGVETFARQEFAKAWANGTGPLPAGVALLGRHLDTRNAGAAQVVLTQLLTRPDADAPLLLSVLGEFDDGEFQALSLPVHERLTQLSPLEDDRVIAWARALDKAGQRDTAISVLNHWGARAWLDEEFAGKLAQAYAELGAMAEADRLFAHAIQLDLPRRNYKTLLNYARIQRERGNLTKAHYLMARAYRQPACRDFAEVIEWSAARGKLEQLTDVVNSLQLPTSTMIPARQALFRFYEEQGKVEEALAVLATAPEVRTPELLAQLRPLANRGGAFESCIEALEGWTGETGPETKSTGQTLALLYTDWANAALREGDKAEAQKRFEKAVEIRGDLLPAAKRLAAFHEREGSPGEAARVLREFIEKSNEPSEREQARKIVEKLEKQ